MSIQHLDIGLFNIQHNVYIIQRSVLNQQDHIYVYFSLIGNHFALTENHFFFGKIFKRP